MRRNTDGINPFQISVNGYLGFATVLDQGPTINVGPDATDWPRQQDPAMIAPYLCKQQVGRAFHLLRETEECRSRKMRILARNLECIIV